MLTLCAVLLLAQSPAVQTPVMDSRFLMHDGAAYVASPTYMLGYKGDQAVWSADSKRVAFITWHPAVMSPRYAGESLGAGRDERLRINLWNADSGEVDEAYLGRADEGVSEVAFLGKSQELVISTFSGSTVETTRNHLIYKRPGVKAQEINLGGETSFMMFPSQNERAVLVVGKAHQWLIEDGRTLILNPPKQEMAGWFIAADDTVQMIASDAQNNTSYYSFDFRTRKYISQSEPKERVYKSTSRGSMPFLMDFHERGSGARVDLVHQDELAQVDGRPFRLDQETGSFFLHLVETSGEQRRRLPFIFEMSRYFWVSPDGMTVVYQSQQMLCARKLLKCNPETTKKWLAQGT